MPWSPETADNWLRATWWQLLTDRERVDWLNAALAKNPVAAWKLYREIVREAVSLQRQECRAMNKAADPTGRANAPAHDRAPRDPRGRVAGSTEEV